MESEELSVNFYSTISTSEYCLCSACRHLGRVVKLTLPRTFYRGGKELTTQLENYWLCFKCREKLMSALMWGEGEEDGN